MKITHLIVVCLMLLGALQPVQAGLGHTIIKCGNSLKTAAIFTLATTATMTAINTGCIELLNRYVYKTDDADKQHKRFWLNGVGYGVAMGIILSAVTLKTVGDRTIAPDRVETFAKLAPYFIPLLSGLANVAANMSEIQAYNHLKGSQQPNHKEWVAYATVFGLSYVGSLIGFGITHLIAG